jgi:hypothetical protein
LSIDLRQCTIQLTSDEQTAANCFEISSGGKDRWFLKATSEELMVDWMIAMRKVKDDMQKLTNPPFSPDVVLQYAPALPVAVAAAALPPSLPPKDPTPIPPEAGDVELVTFPSSSSSYSTSYDSYALGGDDDPAAFGALTNSDRGGHDLLNFGSFPPPASTSTTPSDAPFGADDASAGGHGDDIPW